MYLFFFRNLYFFWIFYYFVHLLIGVLVLHSYWYLPIIIINISGFFIDFMDKGY